MTSAFHCGGCGFGREDGNVRETHIPLEFDVELHNVASKCFSRVLAPRAAVRSLARTTASAIDRFETRTRTRYHFSESKSR